MDSATIKACIAEWGSISHNGTKLVDYFDQGNCFTFEFPTYPHTSDTIHVYLGIDDKKLKFFLIPSAYDNEEYEDDIASYVTICDVMWTVTGGRIPTGDAIVRIDAWKSNYETWVPTQALTANGIFLAFSVPVEDFESETSELVLGLKTDPANVLNILPDLIVVNEDGNKTYFDDFVRSVPPFGTSDLSESNFYLLQ